MKKLKTYDVLSIFIILIFLIVTVSRYDLYPVFVDIYYHLSVTLSFDKAGGIVLWDFWEFAPEGRVHLYPPFLHCLMLLLSEGSDYVAVGKFISFVMFPASQVTAWVFCREILSRKTAFYALLILSSSLMYFKLQAVTSAAALVLVIIPLLFYAFEKGKYIASVILLTVCLYTHVGFGPTALSAFAMYSILHREKARDAAKVIAASLILYIPWGIHVVAHMEYLSAASPPSPGSLIVIPWILGTIGFFLCLQRRKEFLIPVSLFVCMFPMAFTYWGRFTGHSMLPLAILSGVTLAHLDEKLKGSQRTVFVIASLLVLSFVAPTVGVQSERRMQPQHAPQESTQQGSMQQRLPPRSQARLTLNLRSLLLSLPQMPSDSYLTPDNLMMAEIIKRTSQENEIVFIPGGIMGCFVTAMTGRPQLLGMWQEVAADYEPDPKSASLFVMPKGRRMPTQLVNVGETEEWAIFKAPQKKVVNIPEATVGKAFIYVGMLIALGALLYDLSGVRK